MSRRSTQDAPPPASPSTAASTERYARRPGDAFISYYDIPMSGDGHELDDADYERLLEFRSGLRRFLRWSEEQSTDIGVTPAHHQLLLAIRGHREAPGPTIG